MAGLTCSVARLCTHLLCPQALRNLEDTEAQVRFIIIQYLITRSEFKNRVVDFVREVGGLCVCVCACVRACVRVCVCVTV